MSGPRLGVIGGTGLYSMPGLDIEEERTAATPFGAPSSPLVLGALDGLPVVFLARHGLHHSILPSEVNYRANIYALKELGVERVVAISACGSLRKDYEPGHIVVPHQLMDQTKDRERTFFGEGLTAHIGVADPFCPVLSAVLVESVEAAEGRVHARGAYVTVEGPRFSTRAESNTYRAWGMHIVGMTTSPEAFLAKEAELCYAVLAHVTDYDVWHRSEEPVSGEAVVRMLHDNMAVVQRALLELTQRLPDERTCSCKDALREALITDPEHVPPETLEKLAPLVSRYFG